MNYETPIPTPGTHTKEFWEGTRQGKLMLPRCEDCNRTHWYPRYICPHCQSSNIEWIQASGEGTIYTYAVQHLVFGKWAKQAPYVTAYIDLKEGDRMLTVLRGVDPNKPEDIKIGTPVRVEFDTANVDGKEEMHIPFWRVQDTKAGDK